MNKLTIIGNLTRDPELRTTQAGVNVCSFMVAVNRRYQQPEGQPTADYFRVSVWRERGENCAKYLAKGKEVCVIGAVSVSTYTANDGTTKAQLEIKSADEVEFLSAAGSTEAQPVERRDEKTNMPIVETDELPF